jgi:photosystem II stability/assembly factor-like uncharacterized protein
MFQTKHARMMLTVFAAVLAGGLTAPALAFAWSREPLPSGIGSLNDISCVAHKGGGHCVSVGQNSSGQGPVALVSDDGGASWSKVGLPSGAAALYGVSCSNASRCWAVGEADLSGDHAAILGSTDGGKTWKREAVPNLSARTPTPYLQRISCVGSHCLATGLRVGAVLETSDGGARWSVVRLPQGCTGFCAAFAPDAVKLASSSVGYAGGGNQCGGPHVTECPGIVWKTTNGGASWRIVFKKTPFVDAITCVDQSHCWVASATFKTGEMYGTANGGRSWSHQTLPSFGGFLNAIACVRASHDDCFAVGEVTSRKAPVIVSTTNGGSKWRLQRAPAGTGPLYGVTLLGTKARAAGQKSSLKTGVALSS